MRALPLADILLVAAGAVLGAVLRFGVSAALPARDFPWATAAVNLAGAFAAGLAMLPEAPGHTARLWFVVGFLGSLTTLSTYSVETVGLWRSGRAGLAVTNVAVNALGGPLLAVAGWRLRAALAGTP